MPFYIVHAQIGDDVSARSPFAGASAPIDIGPIVLRPIDGFLALVPDEQSADVTDFAAKCVVDFDPLRAPVKREGGRSYLPDPAAEAMSLRLRVTGSDKYLKHDVLLEPRRLLIGRYDGADFEHPLLFGERLGGGAGE